MSASLSLDLAAHLWRCALPRGVSKLVLQCFCHHVNNESGLSWPSITRVALMCGLSERAVQGHVRRLVTAGILRPRLRTGRTTRYAIDLSGLTAIVFEPATVVLGADAPVDNLAQPDLTPAVSAANMQENDLQPAENDTKPVEICTLTIKRTIELTEDRTAAPASPVAVSVAEGVTHEVMANFAACRKDKFGRGTRGKVTAELIDAIRAEASIAGLTLQTAIEHCCHPDRRWASFKAAWMTASPSRGTAPAAPVKLWQPDTTPIPPASAAKPAGPPPEPVKLAAPEVVAAALAAYRAKPAPAAAPAMPTGASDISIPTDAPPWAAALIRKAATGQRTSRAALNDACAVLKIDPASLRRAAAPSPAARMH